MKTNLKTLHELERPTRTISLGWLAAFSIPFICGAILSIWSAALRAESDHILGETSTAQGSLPPHAEGGRILNGGALRTAEPSGSAVASQNPWKKTIATFYGDPYDSRPSRYRTSDGTPYASDGMFCATYLVPKGTTIEVRRGKVTLTLVVRDRPARKNGHKIDIPSKTWDKLGAKRSTGVLSVEWRRAK